MDFSFEANTVIKDITVVPEQFRSLFAEDPAEKGTFRVVDDPKVKGAVEAILGLNKALKAERGVSKDLKGRVVDLAPLSEYGKAPEEIAAGIRAKLEELTSQVAAGKGAKLDLEKIKADIAAANAKNIEAKDVVIKGMTTQLDEVLIDNALRSAIGDQAVDADLVMPFAKSFIRSVQENGQRRAVVVDVDGSQRYSGTTGQPMTVAELVVDMKRTPKYAPLFKSEAKVGGGTPAGASAGKVNGKPKSGMDSISKIARGMQKQGM